MPSQTPSSSVNHTPPFYFPPPQTFDIVAQIHDLITRLPPPLASRSSNNNLPQSSTSESLEPKDLPQAAVPIKLKIQKAKATVSALPDVDRTIEEQEDEIKELERKIVGLKGLVAELGSRAGGRSGELDRNGDGAESRAMEGV